MLLALAAMMSLCCVFGVSYVIGEGFAVVPLWAALLLGAGGTLLFAGALLLCSAGFERLVASPANDALPPVRHATIPVLAGLLLVFWLPWIVANFPGGTYWDTYWQMWQVYPEAHPVPLIQWPEVQDDTLTDAWLVDHHPVLTTLIYGGAAWASDQLTGTWMTGVFVLSLGQVIAYAFLFASAVHRLRTWGAPRLLCVLAFALFALLPSFPVWADCVVKDSTFGLFFFPWMMMLADCVRTRGASMADRRQIIGMCALALLMCLTKKTGVFIVVATAAAACWAFRTQRPRGASREACSSSASRASEATTACQTPPARRAFRAFAIQGISCFIVMCVLMPLVIFPAANIAPGGKQEMLGVLFQQTARYAQAHELTADEEAVIDAVVDVERVQDHYDSDFQDAVKYYYRVDASAEELTRYLTLWAQQGAEDPEAYGASVGAIAGLYLAPTTYLNLRMVTVDTKIGEEDRPVLWNPPELDVLREGLDDAYKAIASIPVVNLPFLTVTYVLWLPCLLAFVCWRRRCDAGLLFVPLIVVVAFCVIAPVFDARYAWPMLLSAPILWCTVPLVPRT